MDNNKKSITWIIVVVVAIILVAIGGYYFYSKQRVSAPSTQVSAPSPVPAQPQEEVVVRQSSLALIPDKSEAKVGNSIKVKVELDLNNQKSNGTDVVLKYDPAYFQLESINPKATKPTKEGIAQPKDYLETSSSSFDIFPYLKVDNKNGSAVFSALASPQKEVAGKADVAILTFKAIKKGESKIDIVFNGPGASTDSNVAYGGKDILSSVSGASITIK